MALKNVQYLERNDCEKTNHREQCPCQNNYVSWHSRPDLFTKDHKTKEPFVCMQNGKIYRANEAPLPRPNDWRKFKIKIGDHPKNIRKVPKRSPKYGGIVWIAEYKNPNDRDIKHPSEHPPHDEKHWQFFVYEEDCEHGIHKLQILIPRVHKDEEYGPKDFLETVESVVHSCQAFLMMHMSFLRKCLEDDRGVNVKENDHYAGGSKYSPKSRDEAEYFYLNQNWLSLKDRLKPRGGLDILDLHRALELIPPLSRLINPSSYRHSLGSRVKGNDAKGYYYNKIHRYCILPKENLELRWADGTERDPWKPDSEGVRTLAKLSQREHEEEKHRAALPEGVPSSSRASGTRTSSIPSKTLEKRAREDIKRLDIKVQKLKKPNVIGLNIDERTARKLLETSDTSEPDSKKTPQKEKPRKRIKFTDRPAILGRPREKPYKHVYSKSPELIDITGDTEQRKEDEQGKKSEPKNNNNEKENRGKDSPKTPKNRPIPKANQISKKRKRKDTETDSSSNSSSSSDSDSDSDSDSNRKSHKPKDSNSSSSSSSSDGSSSDSDQEASPGGEPEKEVILYESDREPEKDTLGNIVCDYCSRVTGRFKLASLIHKEKTHGVVGKDNIESFILDDPTAFMVKIALQVILEGLQTDENTALKRKLTDLMSAAYGLTTLDKMARTILQILAGTRQTELGRDSQASDQQNEGNLRAMFTDWIINVNNTARVLAYNVQRNSNYIASPQVEDYFGLSADRDMTNVLYDIESDEFEEWSNIRSILVINEENSNLTRNVQLLFEAITRAEEERQRENEQRAENAAAAYNPDPVLGYDDEEEVEAENENKEANKDDSPKDESQKPPAKRTKKSKD